jgi:glycosyltransferase involved in cell wall biosynthesis
MALSARGNPMQICQIVPSLEERHGGPSRSVHQLSLALARAGHRVNLLTTGPGPVGTASIDGLVTESFHRDWPQALCPSAGMRRRVLGLAGTDIVHHHSLWLRTLHYAHEGARRSGARLVISPRGMMSRWAWSHHGLRKLLARHLIHPGALESADGWHATSPEEEADIRALGFKQPVCVASNGVDEPERYATDEAARYWREACPEVARRPVALFYSRFHRKKRVLDLIDAWLAHAPRDWLLLLVGIPEEYTPEMLEAYVLRTSGGDRVRVFSGAGRPAPYAVASLFVLPSHNENFGLVIAEAMAHGVPAVVTDTTPWRELNRNQFGWCVPWEEFGAALRTACSEEPASLRARGERARDWVLREFSWAKPALALADFYAGLKARNP